VTSDDDTAGDWEGKHVPAALFRQQLAFLARTRKLVTLEELVNHLAQGRDGSGMTSLTFDDGYLNNATIAAPILRELGVPATFFVATGFLDRRRWLWNDRLENALHRSALRSIEAGPRTRSLENVEQRRLLLREKKRELKLLPWREAEASVERFEQSLEVEAGEPRGIHEFMEWNDAARLNSWGFSVGAHTVNHALLSRVPLEEARQEISASRDRVIAMVGRCNPVFCYPNGKRADYTDQVVDYCRGEFLAALSAEPGLARKEELFELRRLAVDRYTTPSVLARELLRAQ
jgi:peptidoglycan/xylan/chitin deacetylase (PgdA/CDA1 family)